MIKALRPLLSDRRRARTVAAASLTLAAAGIVLLRAPRPSQGETTPAPATPVRVTPTQSAQGAAMLRFSTGVLHGRVAMSQGAVRPDAPDRVYAELRVTADAAMTDGPARPVAMAVVLDVSGSMSGEKIEQARSSVLSLVDQMRDSDQIALVTYSDNARVVQPLARVADVRQRLHGIVPGIQIEGGTNIPEGLSAGVGALEAAPSSFVQRVVLVSDGQDTSGQPLARTAASVRSRAERGVTLSALGVGVGYDERFMSSVADAGRGNYEFLRDGAQLRTFLTRELSQASHTAVERASVDLTLPRGWRLVRGYGAEVAALGRRVQVPLGSLYAGEERRLVLELAVDPDEAQAASGLGRAGAIAARLDYRDVRSARDVDIALGVLPLAVARDAQAALASRDVNVFAEAEGTVIAARQADAVVAWRSGRGEQAANAVQQNLASLRALQGAAPTAARSAQIRAYERDMTNFNALSAASEEGRAYGLRSNAVHRRALRSASAY